MTLPNFLVIGSPKCATTAICSHLDAHPQICFSKPKETFYFCWEKFHDRGLDWYRSCFAHHASEPAIGEGTTLYSCIETFPLMLGRITETLDNPKIVFCVRQPFERMQSYFIEMRSQGQTMKTFAEDLHANTEYVDGSMYGRTYDAYASAFGADRIHCVFYDDFKADAAASMSRLFAFLDVDPGFVPDAIGGRIYGSAGKREDRPLVNLFRRYLPGFDAIRNAAPGSLRSAAKKYLKTPIEGPPEWDDASYAWAAEQVSADVRRFLEQHNRHDLITPWLESPSASN